MAASAFQPLHGVQVLDLTEGVAGPYACQVMADLGAGVIKVERPQGDWGRTSGSGPAAGGYHFRALNRNRRNLCLDLRRDRGLEVAWRLLDRAQVMVTSYRPGVMESLGLGYEEVRRRVPSLVYARISAYGPAGPLARRPGSDTILQAISGLMSQIGEPDGAPQRVGVPVVDYLAARDTVVGVLAALLALAAGQTLPGPVDVSLFGSAAAVQAQVWLKYFASGAVQRRSGYRNESLAPAGLYRTRDGRYVAVAVLRDEHFAKLCEAASLPELADDPRFATNADRLRNREELEAVLVPAFAARDFDDWARRLLEHDVLAGPVTEVADIAGDADLAAALPLVELPDGPLGDRTRAIGLPISFGAPLPTEVDPPALRGQHTREVLAGAGFTEAEIEELVRSGVTQATRAPD